MSTASPVWVWTPLFSHAVGDLEPQKVPDTHIIRFDPADPGKMLLSFRRIREDEGDRPVTVFDVARFPDDKAWAYVADGVNRSGANPLRGLGAVLREPFIDVSRLYSVPAGENGLEVVSLGARYPAIESGLFESSRGRPICSCLHEAAILAHAEGLAVTGVLVAEAHVPGFNFGLVQKSYVLGLSVHRTI